MITIALPMQMQVRNGFPNLLRNIWITECFFALQMRQQVFPGVLTKGAADPTLPCSYFYEMRPTKKVDQEILWMQEGDMTPIVRCEHHRLNLSVVGKLYRNGPERTIYNSNDTEFSALSDFLGDLRVTTRGEFS